MDKIDRILARIPLRGTGPLQQQEILRAVGSAIGDDVAKGLRVGPVRGRCVTLEASSAAVAFELNSFHRADIERALRDAPDLEGLNRVRIRVGSWREHGGQGRGADGRERAGGSEEDLLLR